MTIIIIKIHDIAEYENRKINISLSLSYKNR